MKKILLKQELLDIISEQLENNKLKESELQCPECSKNMKLVTAGSTVIDYCIYCNSIWFNNGELATLTGEYKDIPSQGLKLRSRKSRFTCPECEKQMEEQVYEQGANLLVDVCPEHGIYLQSRELSRAIDLSSSG